MPILTAESNFTKGLAALMDNNHADAAVYFGRALELERRRKPRQPESRYLSYYGFSVAKARRSIIDAIDACRRAVELDDEEPELWLNLGRVYTIAGLRTLALWAFERGLRLDPGHAELRMEREDLERRHRPVFPTMPRDHPLNHWLGRVRAEWRRQRSGEADPHR